MAKATAGWLSDVGNLVVSCSGQDKASSVCSGRTYQYHLTSFLCKVMICTFSCWQIRVNNRVTQHVGKSLPCHLAAAVSCIVLWPACPFTCSYVVIKIHSEYIINSQCVLLKCYTSINSGSKCRTLLYITEYHYVTFCTVLKKLFNEL